jgi:hypothetical protein
VSSSWIYWVELCLQIIFIHQYTGKGKVPSL